MSINIEIHELGQDTINMSVTAQRFAVVFTKGERAALQRGQWITCDGRQIKIAA